MKICLFNQPIYDEFTKINDYDIRIQQTQAGQDPYEIEWKSSAIASRHLKISTAMEKAAMRLLAEEGLKLLDDYINKLSSKIGRIEISVFNTKKSFGQRPEHVHSAKEILEFLKDMKKVLYNPGKYIEFDEKLRMNPVANFISEHSPASESKGSYRNIHARLLEMSVPHTAEFRKVQFLSMLSSTLGQSVSIPSVLVEIIKEYLKDLPSEEFHGRDIDDYSNGQISTYLKR